MSRKKPRKPLCFHWRGWRLAGFAYRARRYNGSLPRDQGGSPGDSPWGPVGEIPGQTLHRALSGREILRGEILRKKRRKFCFPRGANYPHLYIPIQKKTASTPLFPLEGMLRSRFPARGTQASPGVEGMSAGLYLPSRRSGQGLQGTGAPEAPVPPEIRAETRRRRGLYPLPERGFPAAEESGGIPVVGDVFFSDLRARSEAENKEPRCSTRCRYSGSAHGLSWRLALRRRPVEVGTGKKLFFSRGENARAWTWPA